MMMMTYPSESHNINAAQRIRGGYLTLRLPHGDLRESDFHK